MISKTEVFPNPHEWWVGLADAMPWGVNITSLAENRVYSIADLVYASPVHEKAKTEFLIHSTNNEDHLKIIQLAFSRRALLERDFARRLTPGILVHLRQRDQTRQTWIDALRKTRERSGPGTSESDDEYLSYEDKMTHIRHVVGELIQPAGERGFAWLRGIGMREALRREQSYPKTEEYPSGYAHYFVAWALAWHPEIMIQHHEDFMKELLQHPDRLIRVATIRAFGWKREAATTGATENDVGEIRSSG